MESGKAGGVVSGGSSEIQCGKWRGVFSICHFSFFNDHLGKSLTDLSREIDHDCSLEARHLETVFTMTNEKCENVKWKMENDGRQPRCFVRDGLAVALFFAGESDVSASLTFFGSLSRTNS